LNDNSELTERKLNMRQRSNDFRIITKMNFEPLKDPLAQRKELDNLEGQKR
jgi:hypothetical protein